jgi:putative oligomerization/nucleic acid binding protein
VGLFKSMKDLSSMTKQAKQLQRQQQEQAGYKPGFGGQMQQMGDMISQGNEQLSELTGTQGERGRILAEGIAGTATVVAMGTPARGAQWFNLDLDLEVNVPGRQAYRVANSYMVPASATLGPGVALPVKVDQNDPSKIAIDWDSAPRGPAQGEVRPVAGSGGFAPAPAPPAGGGDHIAELERLAKLRDSGALTDAEFEQQKAKVLGS